MQKKVLLICLIGVLFISGCVNKEGETKMEKENKKLEIDFLYLDMSVCERCQATDKVLDEALDELREEIRSKNVTSVSVNKIKVTSDEEAKEYGFVRSPTIRINGVDVEEILSGKLEIKDNYCGSCSEVCGEDTNCRTFEYNGRMYNSPPKEMIKEAIKQTLGIEAKKEPEDVKESEVKSSCCSSNSQTPSCCGSGTNNVCKGG